MKPSEPRVSVIVPAYNVSQYVGDTLNSLLRQDFTDFEVIVVDDGSTDETVKQVERFDDPRVRLIRHTSNSGLASARNTGMAHAQGEFIALLDADDIAAPDRLSAQVTALEADSALQMVGSHVAIIDESGRPTGEIWRRPTAPEEVSIGMLFRNTLSAVMMFRRSAIPVEGFRALPMAEDYDFNARVALAGKVANLDRPLTYVRVRASGLTQSRQREMVACVSSVMRDQIRSLGLEPSDRELAVHRQMSALSFSASLDFLSKCDAWLGALDQANHRSRRFPEEQFKRILGKEWYEVCKFSTPLGLSAYFIWKKGLYRRYWHPHTLELAKFMVKSLLRHRRRGGDVPALPTAP